MAKRKEYRICFGFSFTPTTGPYKGKRTIFGPGEPVPGDILKDKDKLNELIRAQKISVKDENGEFQVQKKAINLTEAQIDMLLKEGNANDLNNILRNPDVSRESLIRLHVAAESRKLPRDVLTRIESASAR